jgi:hypothetical protein
MKHFLDLPPKQNAYYDTRMRYELHDELLFVFGSNESGFHGAGAAKYATLAFGAVYGQPFGIQGRSFAIPTRNRKIVTLPLKTVKTYVDKFLDWSVSNPGRKYYITPIGTGLAGYRHHQIAPLFKGIENAWLPLEWMRYLKD